MRGSPVPFPSYAQYTNEQLLDAFTKGPDRLRAAIAGLTEEELRARARGPRRWSALKIVIHTVDSESKVRTGSGWSGRSRAVIFLAMIRMRGARELDYLGGNTTADRENALELLAALRRAVTPLLIHATADDWNRWGTHPEYGKVTLRNLLELYADHTERHIAQILHIREILGRSTNLTLLLPDRLYS